MTSKVLPSPTIAELNLLAQSFGYRFETTADGDDVIVRMFRADGSLAMTARKAKTDCIVCDGYVLDPAEAPYCPTCARLLREGKPL